MNFRIFIKKLLPGGIFSREFCIQDGFSGMKELELVEPKLHLIQSAAGSFECSFHKDSVIYKSNADDGKPWVEMGKTRIIIRKFEDSYSNGSIIWEGRVFNMDYDFYGQEHIYVEGALSYLNDSMQPIRTYSITSGSYSTPGSYYMLSRILEHHNLVCPDKRIEPKEFSYLNYKDGFPTTPLTNIKEVTFGNESTMSALSKLLSVFGGKMRITYEDNTAKLEWYKVGSSHVNTEAGESIAQIIFTKNMMDFEKKRDLTSLATYVYPRGYKAYPAGDYAVGDDMMLPMEGSDWSRITWTTGSYIHTVSDQQGAVYEWVYDGSDYHDTMSTGFYKSLRAVGPEGIWPNQDPRRRVDPDDPNSPVADTLEVHPGEYYYITLTQSNGRTCYIITANDLGQNPAYVISSQAASSSDYPSTTTQPDQYGQTNVTYPTTWRYQKIQVPTDDKMNDDWKEKNPDGTIKTDADGKPIYNKKFYLNVSSRGTFNATGVDVENKDGSYSYLFDDYGNRKVGIWKGRYIPSDEYITLKGLGDGSYDIFFVSVSGTSVPVKMKSQAGKDREIPYPKSIDTGTVATYEDLPNPNDPDPTKRPNHEDIYYVTSLNKRYYFNYSDIWELCQKDTAAELSGIQAKQGSTWWVVEDNAWWVSTISTSSGQDTATWLRQKTFHRDGYYIYMDSLVSQYGRIEKFIDYSNVLEPDMLEDYGLAYLYTSEFESLNLTVKAVDLSIIDSDYNKVLMFEVLGQVHVTSSYHGISDTFYIQEIEYDFSNLGNTTIEVGYSKVLRITDTTKDLVKFG